VPKGNERLPDDDAERLRQRLRILGFTGESVDGLVQATRPPHPFLPYPDPLAAWEAQQRYDASIAPARSFYDQEPKPKIFDQWDQWELSFWRIKP
jgi:hypothetical protein